MSKEYRRSSPVPYSSRAFCAFGTYQNRGKLNCDSDILHVPVVPNGGECQPSKGSGE